MLVSGVSKSPAIPFTFSAPLVGVLFEKLLDINKHLKNLFHAAIR